MQSLVEKTKKIFRSIKLFRKNHFFPFSIIVLFLSIFISYWNIWQSYFVQDEWYYFGLYNQFIRNKWGFLQIFIDQFTHPKLYSVHFTPLWDSLFFLEYKIFGLHYVGYALFAMLLHVLTSLLIMYLVLKISKSHFIAFIAGLLFAISQGHMEAVTWANTHLQTQLPSIIVILSIILWTRGSEKNSRLYYIFSMVLFFVGLFIKETIFGIFFFLFFFHFLTTKNKILRKTGFFYLLFTFIMYCILRGVIPIIAIHFDRSIQIGPSIPQGIFDIGPQLYRMITFPFKALVQEFFPIDFITTVAEKITIWNYPVYAKEASFRGTNFLTFVDSAASDIVILYISVILGSILFYVYSFVKKLNSKTLLHTYFFGIAFVFSSVLSLLVIAPWISTLFSYVTYIDSRHLYLISIGSSILFAAFAYSLHRQQKRLLTKNIFIATLLIYIFFNIFQTQNAVEQKVVAVGSERKKIIETIVKTYPKISNKAIFYIQSNMPYYGFAVNMPPFQNNFGRTLLVLYDNSSHFDPWFYTSGFLIEKGLTAQGYHEIHGNGFGYFLQGSDLVTALKKYRLSPEIVYAFSYDGVKKETTDITRKVRRDLVPLLGFDPAIADWNTYQNDQLHFKFSYPPIYQVKELPHSLDQDLLLDVSVQKDSQKVVDVIVHKNSNALDIESFVLAEHDSLGNPLRPLGPTFTRPGVLFNSITPTTIIRVDLPQEISMYIPQTIGNTVKQILFTKGSLLDEFPSEKFLRTFSYDF